MPKTRKFLLKSSKAMKQREKYCLNKPIRRALNPLSRNHGRTHIAADF